jgi:hypothetical protein
MVENVKRVALVIGNGAYIITACLSFGLIVLVWTADVAMAAKRVALVIGNSNYPLGQLTNPQNDAEDVAAVLERLNFEVIKHKDLTVAGFDNALDEFITKAKGADVALFFFAGHGLQIDNRGFLVPVDFKTATISGAFRELVAIQGVISRIEHAAEVSVVMIDACRDSPLHERMRRIAKAKNRALPARGLPTPSVMGSNTLVVYATVPGEVAKDGSGRNSPFTAAFLRHVETPGLDIEVLFKDVTADVLRSTNGGQQPERLSRLQTRLELMPGSSNVVAWKRKHLAKLKAKQFPKQQPPIAEAEREKTEDDKVLKAAVLSDLEVRAKITEALHRGDVDLAVSSINDLHNGEAKEEECERIYSFCLQQNNAPFCWKNKKIAKVEHMVRHCLKGKQKRDAIVRINLEKRKH